MEGLQTQLKNPSGYATPAKGCGLVSNGHGIVCLGKAVPGPPVFTASPVLWLERRPFPDQAGKNERAFGIGMESESDAPRPEKPESRNLESRNPKRFQRLTAISKAEGGS